VPEAVVDTLGRLVAWDSTSHRPLTDLAAFLAERAEGSGMRVEVFETNPGKVNVVASLGPPGTNGLLLSGHMDVVPVEGQAWSSDPFQLKEADGRLFGRGTCDMKGFIAATLCALDGLKGAQFQAPLVLIWTHDEEVGCRGSQALVERLEKEQPGRAFPEAAIIGEPTNFEICTLHPGHATFEVLCQGRPAHSSRPQLGFSAISLAGAALAVLDQFAEELTQRRDFDGLLPTPWTVLNVGQIEGGTAVNIVPEHCKLRVGIRPLPGISFEDLLSALEERLLPLRRRAQAAGGDIRLNPLQNSRPLESPSCCAAAELLKPWGRTAGTKGAPFATDGGNLARLGLAPVVFGPGSIDQAHRPDEYIEGKDLFRTVDLLGRLIHARCLQQPLP
jgi:acetylornithine deacetylase